MSPSVSSAKTADAPMHHSFSGLWGNPHSPLNHKSQSKRALSDALTKCLCLGDELGAIDGTLLVHAVGADHVARSTDRRYGPRPQPPDIPAPNFTPPALAGATSCAPPAGGFWRGRDAIYCARNVCARTYRSVTRRRKKRAREGRCFCPRMRPCP